MPPKPEMCFQILCDHVDGHLLGEKILLVSICSIDNGSVNQATQAAPRLTNGLCDVILKITRKEHGFVRKQVFEQKHYSIWRVVCR